MAIGTVQTARFVGFKCESGNNFGKEKIGPFSGYYQLVVAAHKAYSGLLCPIAFANRCGVHTDTATATGSRLHILGHFGQFPAYYVVIVLSIGIIGELRRIGRLKLSGIVVERNADDRLRPFEQQGGIVAHRLMVFHIAHRGMFSCLQPAAIFSHGAIRNRMHAGKPAGIKPAGKNPFPELFLT